MKSKNNIFKITMIVIITALISCIITAISIYNFFIIKIGASKYSTFGKVINNMMSSISTINSDENNSSIYSKIIEIQSKLDELYIGEYDNKKMIDGALEGYVDAVGDEYTEYLDEEEIEDLKEDVNGAYVGVGLYIAQNTQTNEILVIGVIEDSPAHKAGILAGDVIKKIDDEEYTGEQVTQASNKMKGIAGTDVKITVNRNDQEIDFNVKRDEIKFKCIKSEELEDNIGYIRISSFGGGCAEDFKKEYEQLESKNIKSLIIDLRGNGGGLVDQSLEIAEMIVPKGSKMLITKDKKNNEETTISSKEPIIDIPIVILVDEYTASASEILTAAIRENTDAKVVGTQTYGKGIIQGIYMLSDQKTGMKITMQEYFTPNHNKLHKIGIKPDEIVELPEEWKGHTNIEREFDTQLNRAVEILK